MLSTLPVTNLVACLISLTYSMSVILTLPCTFVCHPALVLILTYLLSMFLYLFSLWEISCCLLAFNTNSTLFNPKFVLSLSVFLINMFVVCFKLNIVIWSPEPPEVLSLSLDDTLFAFAQPRAFIPSSELMSVLSLFVTVPYVASVAANVTV